MSNIPVITARKLIKLLRKNGFVHSRTEGSHQIFFHPGNKRIISVPVHAGKDLGRGITRAILKDADILPESSL